MNFPAFDDLSNGIDFPSLAFAEGFATDNWQFPALGLPYVWRNEHADASNETHTRQNGRRHRGRVFTGCVTCRDRKIKCDGHRPVCNNCRRSRGYTCRGFIENPRNPRISGKDVSTTPTGIGHNSPTTDSIQEAPDQINDQSLPPTSLNDELVSSPIRPHTETAATMTQDTSGEGGRVAVDILVDDDLLNYYRTMVTTVMMPTIDPLSNPWLQIYFPLACGEPSTPSKLALRHALVSVAAYQRACREGTSKQQDMRLGYQHEQEASRILKSVVECHSSTNQTIDDKSTTLAAALGLISVDIFGPRATDCSIHLNYARRIIDKHRNNRSRGTNSLFGMLYQIFRCYEMVANTAKLATEPSQPTLQTPASEMHDHETLSTTSEILDGFDGENEFEAGMTDAGCFILDSSFGISKRTMSLLRQTIRYGSVCSSAANSTSSDLAEAVRALYCSLYAIEDDPTEFLAPVSPGCIPPCADTGTRSSIHLNNPGGASLPKLISNELIENHQWAFHYAVIIYFHRVIPKHYIPDLDDDPDSPQINGLYESLHGSISRKQSCQSLIRKVWDRLENIDCLTPPEIQLHRGNVLWPAFIAAAESVQVELRHRALIWFSKASKRGVGNIPRAKEVVMEVWRRVDRQTSQDCAPFDLGPVDWRVVMKETGQSIMLT